MEWVETTAKTVAEAQELALDKLGVDELEAEFEVLEEPRQGLFGRVRGEARVRARIQPKAPRSKDDRGRRRRKPKGDGGNGGAKRNSRSDTAPATADGAEPKSDSGNAAAASSGGGSSQRARRSRGDGESGGQRTKKKSSAPRRAEEPKEEAPMEEVQASVEGFLTGLTEAFGFDSPVELDVSDDEIMGRITGKHGLLLGPKARTLDAIQELTRVTAQRTAPSSIRIKVDVGGYREQRKIALQGFAQKAADKALADDVEVVLEPMTSADRKVVHDALNEVDGVSTRSAGTDPRRYVVVVPDAPVGDDADDDDESEDANAAD